MAFDPDAYLAKSSPKKAFDPDAYLAKASGPAAEVAAEEEGSFDWESPVSSALKGSLKLGAKGLEKVGETFDRYSGAPTRAGLLAGIKGENPLTAAKNQFGEDPRLAPTGEQIVGELGMEEGIPRTALGFGVDVLADPLNVIPVTKLTGINKVAGLIENAPKAAKAYSEGKALKQAGGMLKDFRRIMGKDKLSEVGQSILRETVPIADEAGKIRNVPILSAGDDVEAVAAKAAQKEKELGSSLGLLYNDVQEKVNKYILGNADTKVLNKLSDSTPNITTLKQEVVPEIKKTLKGQGKSGPIKAVENYLDDLLEDYGDRPLDLMDLHEIKSKLGKEIKWNRAEFPNRDLAFQDVYKNVSKKIDDQMSALDSVLSSTGEAENLKTLKDLNKRFSIMTDVSSMSSDKVAREAANRMVSPSDYWVGIGTAVMTGNPATGILTGAANSLGRGRGAGILARGADLAARGSERIAPMTAEGLRSLRSLDKPVVKGLLKKAKRDEEDAE